MITDFLKMDIPAQELGTALKVLRAFKSCESGDEFVGIAFAAWAKLEQLEEFLEHRVEGALLAADTVEYMTQTAAAK